MRTLVARHIFSALAVALVGSSLAVAQVPGEGMQHGPMKAEHRAPFEQAMGNQGRWWNNPRMIDQLKITDDQRKAMDDIWYQHREKLIDLQANLQRAELAMEPLMSADQPDQAAMEAQIDKIVNARAELERANARFLLDIRMKLTPDQWKALKDMRQHMGEMGRRMDRPNKDGQGGPGQRMWRQRRGGQDGAPSPPDGQAPPASGTDGQAPAPGSNPPPQ